MRKRDNNNDNDNFVQIRDGACLNHGECPQKQVWKYVCDLNTWGKKKKKRVKNAILRSQAMQN